MNCENCGAFVTRDFVRVFGTDDAVHRCPSCADMTEIKRGYGATPEARRPPGR